jgi:hypothetical protein
MAQSIVKRSGAGDILIRMIIAVSGTFALVGLLQTTIVWAAWFSGALPSVPESSGLLSILLDHVVAVVTGLTAFWCVVSWCAIQFKRGRAWARKAIIALISSAVLICLLSAVAAVASPGFPVPAKFAFLGVVAAFVMAAIAVLLSRARLGP